LIITANVVPGLPILVTLMVRRYVPPKRPFLQEPHDITSQKTAFFILAAMKTSNLTRLQNISTIPQLSVGTIYKRIQQ
jgi:hypothetical protein